MRAFGVIPAAGRSVRMGRPKLLLPWRGGVVIDAVLSAWRKSRAERYIVVLHPEDRELAERCREGGAVVVAPEKPPAEMKESIELALRHVREHFAPRAEDAWILAPADMPWLSAALIDRLLDEEALAGERRILIPVTEGRRGHPVLFPWTLAAEVARLASDEGVNVLRQRFPVREIELADAELGIASLQDLDTPDDYRRLMRRDMSAD